MNEWDLLKSFLETSIKKNGNQPLTVQHLLNMMNMVDKKVHHYDKYMQNLANECTDPNG